MKSSNTSDTCADRGSDSSGGGDEHKTFTSYAQKVDCKKEDDIKCSSDVDDIAKSIDSTEDNNSMSICAACGKTGDNLKACKACHLVKYCNRECQISHWSKHKKECRKRAAELAGDDTTSTNNVNEISEGISNVSVSGSILRCIAKDKKKKTSTSYNEQNEELFADPPPKEECPLCMLPMPHANGVCGIIKAYMPCCGKMMCEGCAIMEDHEVEKGNLKDLCSFCRVPSPYTNEEFVKRLMKRAKANDHNAFYALGGIYRRGGELSQDMTKAFEMMNKAAELGLPMAHYNIAMAYLSGHGVERDLDKGSRHLKLAAIGGDEVARHKLGVQEARLGNMDRAMKHFMIAARSGYDDALKEIGEGYKAGHLTKDEYASTLRAHQSIRNEMKSEERTRAAANRL